MQTYAERMEDYTKTAQNLRLRAQRVRGMVHARAQKLSREAGLDPNLLGIHPHNAMCALAAGNPWRGVDYSKVRKIQRLLRHQFRADDLVSAYLARKWPTVMGA